MQPGEKSSRTFETSSNIAAVLPEKKKKSGVYCVDLYLFYASACTSISSPFSFVCRSYQVFAVHRIHINSCLLLQLILAGAKEDAGVAVHAHKRGHVLFISPSHNSSGESLQNTCLKKHKKKETFQLTN